jgi:acyl-homoserine-lactone acylase
VWGKGTGGWTRAAGARCCSTGSGAGSWRPFQPAGRDGGRCPVARTLLTYGQSSDPGSPHSSDRTRLHSGEKWETSRFCEKDILASPKPKVVWARERR